LDRCGPGGHDPLSIVAITIIKLRAGKSLGVRSIQFVGVASIVPAAALLTLNGFLQGEPVAAILAGLAGYLLSNIARFDDREN
jgi:hypothetical protein